MKEAIRLGIFKKEGERKKKKRALGEGQSKGAWCEQALIVQEKRCKCSLFGGALLEAHENHHYRQKILAPTEEGERKWKEKKKKQASKAETLGDVY